MKVDLGTIEVTDEQRRAIRRHVGLTGLATRDEVRAFIVRNGLADLDVVVGEARAENDEPKGDA